MAKRKAKARMGRPPKADRFTAQMAVQCHPWHKAAAEAYRVAHGLRSEGEVVRLALEKLTGAKPPRPAGK